MSPRALTEQEKEVQKERLITITKSLVCSEGLKHVSVDAIVKEVGISKGSFYQYFSSKEELLLALLWEVYSQFLGQAQELIQQSTSETLEPNMRGFIKMIMTDPEQSFFFANHKELEYLISISGEDDLRNFNQMEIAAYQSLLEAAGRNTTVVDPAVVHNYLHAMYFASIDDSIIKDKLPETIEVMLDGLMLYLFQENR